MVANKYPGKCSCGATVPALAGTLAKARGKWIITCENCARPMRPDHEMVGVIFWPNGEGETECTEEYQRAYDKFEDAQARYAETESPEDYEAVCCADSERAQLQVAGHLGRTTRYDKPDAFHALLGGGRVDATGRIVTR